MKHHIIIKFLAVFLCAASLLGIIGSGLGIFAMTELGLRDRTVEEAYSESVESTAEALANDLAVRYAARTLGHADDYLLDQYYGSHWLRTTFDWDQVGYTIRDAEGAVLEAREQTETTGPLATTYTFEASGRYLNVLNRMTQHEYEALRTPVTEPTYAPTEPLSGLTVYNAVPAEGCDITYLHVTFLDGHTADFDLVGEVLGVLSYYTDNQLIFRPVQDHAEPLFEPFHHGSAVHMIFGTQDGGIMLEISAPDGVLDEFCRDPGISYLLLRPLEEAVQLPSGEIYDAIPPEGQYVSTLYVKYADGYEESVGGSPDIGFLDYDKDGFVVFTASDSGLLDRRGEGVVHISFSDAGGNMVYEAVDYSGVGSFALENDTLVFRSGESTGMEYVPSEPETGVYEYDDVPPRGYAVYEMDLWLEGSDEMLTITGEEDRLGLAAHDDSGNVIFIAEDWKDFVFSKPAQVRYILMSDLDGRILYEAYEAGMEVGTGAPIGYFAYNETGDLVFGRSEAVPAPASMAMEIESSITAPETAAEEETIPVSTEISEASEEPEMTGVPEETVEVTVPQTSPESIPETTPPVIPGETEPSPVPTYAADSDQETLPASTDPYALAVAADNLQVFGYYDGSSGEHMVVEYSYEAIPSYTVEIVMGPGALQQQYEWLLVEQVYRLGDLPIFVLVACLLLFAVTAVYLCCAAGKRPGTTEIRAGGLNCIPIDLYLAAAVGGVILCTLGVVEGGDYLLRKDLQTGILFCALMAYAASLLIVGFCFAFAAQVKTPGGYWWKNSICGRSLKLIAWLWNKFVDLCGWLWKFTVEKLKPLMIRLFKALWKLTKFFFLQLKKGTVWLCRTLLQGCNWLSRVLGRFLSMLPLTWQFLLIGFSLVVFLYIMIRTYKVGYILIGFGIFFGVILYAASAFGILLENAKRMRKGDLDSKVDDKLLIGAFREFADELNGLADVAVVAAQKQLKSERMKTELITNVSHDIKTPLTSIINYVDLMEKPHSPEEQAAYLEVLSRQSLRLKKLIDDLMEMSKASTGNMAVDIMRVDAAEAVNQALGEFADKLERAQLIPVFRQPEKDILMMADGRLVWRVLSNVLSNAVKYALPGTRVYIDLMELEGKVVLSLKNISREPLNVSAEDLMERFVRGDSARNTEGSGLGLNIAQSLMELQKGKLELLVDGDLFKVTLIFPGA